MTIANQNIQFLDQALALLRALGDDRYRASAPGGGASVGAHLRHIIDYFQCFLNGLEDQRVDYDSRCRDACIEESVEVAAAAITDIVLGLRRLEEGDAEKALDIKVDAAAASGADRVWSCSSVARELQFLMSHTVHHYALISLTLRAADFDPGDDFGVAPSTLEHRQADAHRSGVAQAVAAGG